MGSASDAEMSDYLKEEEQKIEAKKVDDTWQLDGSFTLNQKPLTPSSRFFDVWKFKNDWTRIANDKKM